MRLPRIDWSALRRRRGRLLALVGALLVVAVIVWAWLPDPERVEVAEVQRGDVVVEVVEEGQSRVPERYVVSAPTAGTLERIELEPGDRVQVGDIVARLTPVPAPLLDPRARAEAEARLGAAMAAVAQAETRVESARISLETAERDARRLRVMLDVGAVARQEVEQAEAEAAIRAEELEAARRAVAQAREEARAVRAVLAPPAAAPEGIEVPSPAEGQVLEVLQESEQAVQAGTPLLSLGDPDVLEVVADLLSADAVQVGEGAQARIERWGGAPLPAHVVRVEPSAFTQISALGVEEQRVNVILSIDAPPAEYAGLGVAFRVEARIAVARALGVRVVPEAALFRRGGGFAAFRVEDGRARLVSVRVGLRNGVWAEVIEGLGEGDVVIVHPSEAIADGVRVVVP